MVSVGSGGEKKGNSRGGDHFAKGNVLNELRRQQSVFVMQVGRLLRRARCEVPTMQPPSERSASCLSEVRAGKRFCGSSWGREKRRHGDAHRTLSFGLDAEAGADARSKRAQFAYIQQTWVSYRYACQGAGLRRNYRLSLL